MGHALAMQPDQSPTILTHPYSTTVNKTIAVSRQVKSSQLNTQVPDGARRSVDRSILHADGPPTRLLAPRPLLLLVVRLADLAVRDDEALAVAVLALAIELLKRAAGAVVLVALAKSKVSKQSQTHAAHTTSNQTRKVVLTARSQHTPHTSSTSSPPHSHANPHPPSLSPSSQPSQP